MVQLVLASLFVCSSLWASVPRSCLFLFESKAVYPLPPPKFIAHGLPRVPKDALSTSHEHTAGSTQYIFEQGLSRIRQYRPDGEIREEIIISSAGSVVFTSYLEEFRNRADLGSEIAQILISKLASNVRAKGELLQLAAQKTYQLMKARHPLIFQKQPDSTYWPRSQREPLSFTQLQRMVGREYLHALGQIRLIFDPHLKRVIFEQKRGNNYRDEVISLSIDGETTRIEGSSAQALRADMDSRIAQGIINYALHHSSSTEMHFQATLMKFRDFIFAELPELFEAEMPKRSNTTMWAETDSGQLVSFTINNQPKPYNPRLGLNQ